MGAPEARGRGRQDDQLRLRHSLLNAVLPGAVVFLCGVWLMAAPFVLDYRHDDFAGYRNDLVTGSFIAVVALFRMLAPVISGPVALVNAALGGWLLLAPFALDYSGGGGSRAAWNDVAVGVVVVALSLTGWWLSRRLRRQGV